MEGIQTDSRGAYFYMDPRARLVVEMDWNEWLTGESTTLSTSVWSCEDDELAIEDESTISGVSQATVSGGLAGKVYFLRNTITAANEEVDSRSIRIIVRDR
jgi:hypothetical protein